MFRWLVFIISFLIILGCNPYHGTKRKYILDRTTFVNLLVDIHLAYAIQGSSEYHEIARKYDSIDIHSVIFRKYDVEKAAFDSTMSFYTKKPEDLALGQTDMAHRASRVTHVDPPLELLLDRAVVKPLNRPWHPFTTPTEINCRCRL